VPWRPGTPGARAHRSMNSGTYSRMLNERSDPCNVGTKMVNTVVWAGLAAPMEHVKGHGHVSRCCRQVAAAGVGLCEKADAATCFGGCRAVLPRATRCTAH
jgi:hypothetical protein